MRKETKIGIFAIITIAMAIWGYKYLNGINILSKKTTVVAVYERVDGLRISAPVMVNGLQVGLVSSFEQVNGQLDRIEVFMNLDPNIRVPKTAVAEIVSASLMGGTEIHLVFSGSCEGDECVKNGDYVKGVTKGVLASFATPEEMSIYMEEITKGLISVVDTLNAKLAQSDDIKTGVKDIRETLSNLKSTTAQLDQLLRSSSGAIKGSLNNVEAITANLKDNNEKISTILANAEKLTDDLDKADLDKLSATADETLKQLNSTLSSSEKTIRELGNVMSGMTKEGEGAIAMLLHDKDFADNLHLSVKNLELLIQDIRLHPERYRRILSKKKMPYEKPANDPGLD